MLYRKVITVYRGLRAEHVNSLWVQNAEDIKAKAGGIYSYRCAVFVKFNVQMLVVNQAVSSQSSTVRARFLFQASACELMLEEVTLPEFSPLSSVRNISSVLRIHSYITDGTHNLSS
jgi:hypothetical protein